MATTTPPDHRDRSRIRIALRSESGASVIEYALIISLISIVALAGIARVGTSTEETFDETAVALEADDSAESGDDEGDETADGGSTATVPSGGSSSGGSASGGDSTTSDGSSSGTDTSEDSGEASGEDESSGDDEGTGDSGTSDGGETSDGTAGTGDDSENSADTNGEGDGGDGSTSGEDESAPDVIAETAGIYGQFQVTFVLQDDAVELDEVEASNWSYRILKDQRERMVLRLTNTETGQRFKVRCWVTSTGTLTSTVTRN